MKKSRIIVPALAMLTLSVAASVTGTVAWFTASRTANMQLNNLAALNTSGDLSLELKAGNQSGEPGVSGNAKTLALEPMRDFSYDVSTGNGYYAILDNEGSSIVSTKKVSPTETVTTETWKAQEYKSGKFLYYANTFTGTFSTTSNTTSYLFFNTNHSKSGLSKDYSYNDPNTQDIDESKNIYRALRVSMVAKTYTGENPVPETEKTIVWAPYRDVNEVINLVEEGTLKTALPVTTAPTVAGYNKDASNSLAKATNTLANVNVVTKSDTDVVTQDSKATQVATHPTNLSTKLVTGNTVKVTFTVWFEGLDACCISNADYIYDAATYVSTVTKEAIKMNFFAIQENAFIG